MVPRTYRAAPAAPPGGLEPAEARSSAAHSPLGAPRRSRAARARRTPPRPRRASCGEQAARDQRARRRAGEAVGRDAAAAAGAAGWRATVGAPGAGPSRRRSWRRTSTSTPLTARVVARRLRRRAGSWSTPSTGAQPSLAAAIASTPEPQPRSTSGPPGSSVEQQLEAQPRRRVRAGAERLAGVDHDLDAAPSRRVRRPTAGARAARPPTSTGWWNARQRVGPVVGDLASSRRRRARRRPPPAGRAARAARPARRRPRTRRRRRRRRPPRPRPARARAARRARSRRPRGATRSARRITRRAAALELAEQRLVGRAGSRRSSSRRAARASSRCSLAQLARDDDVDDDAQVAAAPGPAQARHAVAARRTITSPGCVPAATCDLDVAVERRDVEASRRARRAAPGRRAR